MDVIYQAADKDFNILRLRLYQSIIINILEPLQVLGTRLEEGKLLVFHQC